MSKKVVLEFDDGSPCIRPTLEQMGNFYGLIRDIVMENNNEYGNIKIIPPREFNLGIDYDGFMNERVKCARVVIKKAEREGTYYSYEKKVKDKQLVKDLLETPAPDLSFWNKLRTLSDKDSYTVLYANAIDGTLFPADFQPFNLAKLGSLLDKFGKIPGVNTPYVFIGTPNSSFCWHFEDVGLYSINYLHSGSPKIWYGFRQEKMGAFENYAAESFPSEYEKCSQFLKHKTTIIDPETLPREIESFRYVQNPGEFMLTLPYGYHCGFNSGGNRAEAVNFADELWIHKGIVASAIPCLCPERVKMEVRLDMSKIIDQHITKGKNTTPNAYFLNIIEQGSMTIKKDQKIRRKGTDILANACFKRRFDLIKCPRTGNGVFKCSDCDTTSSRYGIGMHYIRHHKSRPNPSGIAAALGAEPVTALRFPCDECGKTFTRMDNMKRHKLRRICSKSSVMNPAT